MHPRRLGSAFLLLIVSVGLTVRFFSILATRMADGETLRAFTIAATLFPTDPDGLRHLGVAQLRSGHIPRGVGWLYRSLRQNPLAPDTWMELGRVHLDDPVQRQTNFELGIREMRTAARLGAGRAGMSLSVGMMLLRLWPLLDSEARNECLQRLKRGITRMGPDEIDTLTRDWFRYSRSWPVMASIMEECPNACTRAAERLLDVGAPLEWRWSLLAAAERRQYAAVRKIHEEGAQRDLTDSELEEMLSRMDGILGYAQLLADENKDWIRYRNFKEDLVFQATIRAMKRFRRKPDDIGRSKVLDCLERLLDRPRALDLADLPRRLEEIGIWKKAGDPRGELLRIRLDFHVGDHAGALERAEQLVPTLTPEFATGARLLAARAAMAVRLMTSALSHVNAVLDTVPANLEALWLRARINRILGEDGDNGDMQSLRRAARLVVKAGSVAASVPLMAGIRVEVDAPPGPVGKRRLLRVMVDGTIHMEKYLDAKKSRTWLNLSAPDELDRMPRIQAMIITLSG